MVHAEFTCLTKSAWHKVGIETIHRDELTNFCRCLLVNIFLTVLVLGYDPQFSSIYTLFFPHYICKSHPN